MAESSLQKLKILYLRKIFLEKTDETHSISMTEILSSLAAYGIRAERKSIYSDIEHLKLYGMDIIGEKEGNSYRYHVGERQFELAELKLLVDSVESAKFMTRKKSDQLIHKIEQLASRYEASQLQRQVYVSGRVKTGNESIYYNVDALHEAIAQNTQISFQYFSWNVRKEQVLRRNGERYVVSPWALSWDDENYYLVAYDSIEDKIKHFRVDKMLHIAMEHKRREGVARFRSFDLGAYAKKTFGMFAGEEQTVTIQCVNELAGVMIDRFGQDIMMRPVDGEHFQVRVKVAVSRQFLGWIMALGEGVRITGPDSVVKQVRDEIRRLSRQYGEQEI
jgi:predicted DNA-binding transcriptional regulator YafY